MYNNNFLFKKDFSFLILDYERIDLLDNLLNSIHDNCDQSVKDRCEIIVLANGGSEEYQEKCYSLYKRKLISTLILKENNYGGGVGEIDLWNICSTEYAFMLQSDHELVFNLNDETIDYFKQLINFGYKVVDVAGAQAGNGVYSERARFMKREFYQSLYPLPLGGPGPLAHLEHNEGYIQNKFLENNWSIAHINPILFLDKGKVSIRSHACGGITKHYTDEKKLFILSPLKQKYDYMGIDDNDWNKILSGEWVNGDIPKEWQKNSFKFWEKEN